MSLKTLADAFYDELRDLLSAERQLTKVLPEMARKASSEQLRKAFEDHQAETEQHVKRVEKSFADTGKTARAKTCEAMKGLIEEAETLLKEDGDPNVMDALMICAAQKVEHYEIATYGTLCTWAESLGFKMASHQLKQNMADEEKADITLSQIAKQVNHAAMTSKKLSTLVDREPAQAAIHHSYWLRRRSLKQKYPSLEAMHKTEVLVIGAGITGLSVALELLERGHQVTVCESNVVGSGTTGGSSGHLDAHPEMGPKQLVKALGYDLAKHYTRMRVDAIETIRRRAGDHASYRDVPAFFYTEHDDRVAAIQEQFNNAIKIGLDVEWTNQVPMNRAVAGYKIDGMARVDCLAYVVRLAELFVERGGTIFERTLVSGPTEAHPTSLAASGGEVQFDHVVSAVHSNYTGSQALYVQTPAYQSYVIAAKIRQPLADALFWDDSSPYFYVRRGTADGRTILVGGCDHRTGDGDEAKALDELESWTRQRFEVVDIVSRWSAELFEPTDGLPFIGKVAGSENVWIVTGLSGVGLTLGTAAAPMLADLLDGQSHPLEKVLSPARTNLGSLAHVAFEQTTAVKSYAERMLPAHSVDVNSLPPGQGDVGKVDGRHVAVCRFRDGCLHERSPICTHMGGVLRWNPAEQTWDCPVHGGRFAADGKRLYGPPENDLAEPS